MNGGYSMDGLDGEGAVDYVRHEGTLNTYKNSLKKYRYSHKIVFTQHHNSSSQMILFCQRPETILRWMRDKFVQGIP